MTALFLQSSRLPVPHGFSVRQGGVSEGPFASLNLSLSVGDERARVEENLRRLTAAVGLQPLQLRVVSQVHGAQVVEARGPAEAPLGKGLGEADALWSGTPGVAVGVKTADCVPILLADPESGRVAAVHSGWRGTDLLIAQKAVEALAAQGSDPAKLVCAIGPCIQRCCYEVSEELAYRFRAKFGEAVVDRRGRPKLGLSAAVRQTLLGAGLVEDRIDVLQHCTACDPGSFFSHRRDQGVTGRHLSFVVAGRGG